MDEIFYFHDNNFNIYSEIWEKGISVFSDIK